MKYPYICFSFLFILVNLPWHVEFKNSAEYLSQGVYPFDDISAAGFAVQKLSPSSAQTFFYCFLHFHTFDVYLLRDSQVLVIFLLSKPSRTFLISSSIPLTVSLFPLFLINLARFSKPNSISTSWFYVLIICMRVPSFSFIFCKYLHVIHIHKGNNLFVWF